MLYTDFDKMALMTSEANWLMSSSESKNGGNDKDKACKIEELDKSSQIAKWL